MTAFYDFFRKITLAPDGVTLEADSTTDTLTINGSNGVQFNPNAATDSFAINVDYQLFVPVGTTEIRLNDVNSNHSGVSINPGNNISITRNASNQLVITSTVGGTSKSIGNISQASIAVITTTNAHGFTEGIAVTITDVSGMTEVNGNEYFMDILTSTTFALYTDSNLSIPLNSTGFTTYSTGGVATAEYAAPQALNQLNDVSLADLPVAGDFLQYNGTSWGAGTTINATLTGDVTGSIFADNSTLLVDGVNGSIPWAVLNGTPTTLAGYAISDAATSAQGATADSALQSLAFSGLTTTPTTLVGYGITDAGTFAQGALADTALQSLAFSGLTTTPTTLAGYGITDSPALYGAESTGGVDPIASGTLSLAIGSSASATGTWATAVGKGASASATYSAAFGNGAKATASFGIALGASVAAGVRSFAAVIDDVSGTYGAKGLGSIAMGKQATATGDNAVAIGFNATAAANQIVLGNNTQTIKAGAFTLFGSTMDTDDSSSITVTPAMVLESNLTVQNDLIAGHNLVVDDVVLTTNGALYNNTIKIDGAIEVLGGGGAVNEIGQGYYSIFKKGIIADGDVYFNRSLHTKAHAKKLITYNDPTGVIALNFYQADTFYLYRPATDCITNIVAPNGAGNWEDFNQFVVTINIFQGSTAALPAFTIDGVAPTIQWQYGAVPTPSPNDWNVIQYQMLRLNAAWYVTAQLGIYN